MTPYRARRYQDAEAEPEPVDNIAEPDRRSHEGLDNLALEAGHTWSSEDLTTAQKRAELDELQES